MNLRYEDMQIKDLLHQLGKGRGMTGAVGAATLSAIMGAELLVSVCKITSEKEEYKNVLSQLRDIEISLTQNHIPTLQKLMQQDVDAVSSLVKQHKVTEELTTTPIDICRECVKILELSLVLFDKGYKVMRGDTVAALSLILSVTQATLFIGDSNLKTVTGGDTMVLYEAQVQELKLKYNRLSSEVKTRIER